MNKTYEDYFHMIKAITNSDKQPNITTNNNFKFTMQVFLSQKLTQC